MLCSVESVQNIAYYFYIIFVFLCYNVYKIAYILLYTSIGLTGVRALHVWCCRVELCGWRAQWCLEATMRVVLLIRVRSFLGF